MKRLLTLILLAAAVGSWVRADEDVRARLREIVELPRAENLVHQRAQVKKHLQGWHYAEADNYFLLAESYARGGLWEQAEELIRAGLKQEPDHFLLQLHTSRLTTSRADR